jgi:hypothetical protein
MAARSMWNRWLEQKLAADLTMEASRLLDAVARETLGYHCTSRAVGRARLRDLSRLHGRSFDRARDELVREGLIGLDGGARGRGHRDTYTLVLGSENAAVERHFQEAQKAAVERPIRNPRKCRSNGPQNAALERPRIVKEGIEEGRRWETLRPLVFETYRANGGEPDVRSKGAVLGRAVKAEVSRGVPQSLLLAAVAKLAREDVWPAELRRVVAEFEANGGVCKWEGIDRIQLTLAQLRACSCNQCAEWARARTPAPEAV